MNVKRGLQAALIAAALAAGTLPLSTTAQAADVSVQFNAGNVAFGFTDGYWDRARVWHPWPSRQARVNWQARNRAHYYARRHDQSPGWGWNDSNRYWERH